METNTLNEIKILNQKMDIIIDLLRRGLVPGHIPVNRDNGLKSDIKETIAKARREIETKRDLINIGV